MGQLVAHAEGAEFVLIDGNSAPIMRNPRHADITIGNCGKNSKGLLYEKKDEAHYRARTLARLYVGGSLF